MALSPDESLLAIGYRADLVELRSFPDLEVGARFRDFDVSGALGGGSLFTSLAFTDDGSSVIGMNEQGATASWSTETFELEWELEPSDDRLAFIGLDDRTIVTAALDGTLILSHVDNPGTPLAELVGHAGSVATMAESGALLASGSEVEGRVRLWDVEAREPYGRPIPAAGNALDISADGRWLAVADGGFVGIWSLDPEDWAESVCDVAGRNLTQEEWDRYLPSDEPYHVTCPQWPAPS